MKNQWNDRYAEKEYYYGTLPNDFLAAQENLLKPHSRILCIAEGEGRNAVYLASKGHKVTALDASSVGLEKLKSLAKNKDVQVDTICQDLNDYIFEDEAWDAIVSIWCHLPSELRRRVHQSIARSLKPEGLFILECYTPEQLKYSSGGPKDPDMLATLHKLSGELSELKPIIQIEQDRYISEGKGHHGLSAVVQLVAKKEIPL